jgi:alcohol dehydrogenase class IV
MEEFLENVGMKLRLRSLGCKLEDARKIAELAMKSSPYLSSHPIPLDVSSISKIYQDSY